MSCTRRVSQIPLLQSQQRCLLFHYTWSCSMGHSWLQGNQVTVVWISMIWCVYTRYIYVSTKSINILSTTNTSETALCLLKHWVWEYSSCVSTETKLRGRQKLFLCQTCYLSLSPRGVMQITRGCEVFVLVINSLYPFCARTILATLPLMSIFIKDYLAHCVLKNINLMLHTFPKNKTQSCLTLCFWIINCSFSFILLPTLQNCKPK